ncbi:MAG: helix-turn-helix domain-containing protein [Bryobacteraceae bacterium]
MLDLILIGTRVAQGRRELNLSQAALSRKAGISRATLDALENGRAGEMGYSKVSRLLAALGLELTIQVARSQRPTLDELLREEQDDESLGRRR